MNVRDRLVDALFNINEPVGLVRPNMWGLVGTIAITTMTAVMIGLLLRRP